MTNKQDINQHRRNSHFTPLRYPGGKAKLAPFVKALLRENKLLDGEYIEPYAGGSAIAIELLLHEYVSRIHINDISKPLYAFWKAILDHTEEFCRLVVATRPTVPQWDKQKRILKDAENVGDVDLGFAFFFLNRTNRSGILNGGIIGGRDQSGVWKIGVRYNARELVHRIEAIARMRARIKLTRQDALKFLARGVSVWPAGTLIYLDPPYFKKGRDLYYDYYGLDDHSRVAQFVQSKISRQNWIVSYDNVEPVRELYQRSRRLTYEIAYSARAASRGSEVMFVCDRLRVPPFAGPIRMTENLSPYTISGYG